MKSVVGIRHYVTTMSPPSRGAWIEMPKVVSKAAINYTVAPLAGGVD